MTVTVTEQPPGTQVSGNAKDALGVIDERLHTQQDVLVLQAAQSAKLRALATQDRSAPMQVYSDGADFSPEFMQMVKGSAHRGVANVSQQTLDALTTGSQNRDQEYVGSNSEWTGYYLEPLAKYIWPVDTPVRNMLPRVQGVGIDYINWRAITDVFNGSGPSVADFILAQQSSPTTQQYVWVDKQNLLRMLARKDVITYESEIYGQLFEPDVRAKIAAKLAPTLMLGQEQWYINAAQKLWTPAYPLLTATTSGGSLVDGTYWFIVTSVNATGQSLGSTAQSVVLSGGGGSGSITMTLFRVPNAVSYKVYCGINSTQPANSAMWLQSAATQFGSSSALNDPTSQGVQQGWFQATMTAAPASSGTAYSTVVTAGNTATCFPSGTDPNGQPLTFDGIQSLIYVNAGTASTAGTGGETALIRHVADSGGALAESDISGLLRSMYLNSRANPECILTSVVDHETVSNIVARSSNFRIVTPDTGMGLSDLVGSYRATKWVNKTTGRLMDIIMVPYLMQGTIIALSLTIPFQVVEITKPPLRVEYNREMWAVDYPPDQTHPTQWMYGCYSNETVISQYLGGLGILNGIKAS